VIRVGDDQLDWDGPQTGQGTVPGENDEEYEVRYKHRYYIIHSFLDKRAP
jgi:hypothetical protein